MPDLNLKVPAIEKLLDYAASGIGAIAGPMLAPWKASSQGKARLAAAHADAEVRRIEAESEAGTYAIIAKARSEARESLLAPDAEIRGTVEMTHDDIIQRIEYQERKRLANIKAVVEDAAEELGDKEVSDHEPDPDWTARFFNCVQDVSSADMQKIWAKLLSGEVEGPGRTSLRTLDTLRNMTKRDAVLLKNICDFIIGGDFVFYNEKYVQYYSPLEYGNLLHLQDCGLVNVGPSLVKEWTRTDAKELVLTYQSGVLMITKNPNHKAVLKIPAVLLTTAGKELFRITQCTLRMKYLQSFSGFLKSENCQLSFLVGVKPLPDGRISYANRIPIEPQSEQVDGATL